MPSAAKGNSVIELHYEDRDGRVRVITPGNHIMALPVELAVEACRAFKNQILFKDQFDALLDRLANWIDSRVQRLSAACLTTRDAGLLFLIVQKEKKRDADLEAQLAELDVEIANDPDYNLIRMSVLSIPSCTDDVAASFMSQMTLRYVLHGNGARAHRLRESNA